MREILFRGQAFGSREWIYGHYRNGRKMHIIYHDENSDNCYAVLPETVGQFTGLTDKNGKKIFEGDVVKDGYSDTVGVVTFGTGTFDSGIYRYNGWHIKKKNGCVDHNELSVYGEENYYEVIGNIHDNPELLGGNEDG